MPAAICKNEASLWVAVRFGACWLRSRAEQRRIFSLQDTRLPLRLMERVTPERDTQPMQWPAARSSAISRKCRRIGFRESRHRPSGTPHGGVGDDLRADLHSASSSTTRIFTNGDFPGTSARRGGFRKELNMQNRVKTLTALLIAPSPKAPLLASTTKTDPSWRSATVNCKASKKWDARLQEYPLRRAASRRIALEAAPIREPLARRADASRFGQACLNPPVKGLNSELVPGSEDCLKLNAFAPNSAHNLPAMVWFHGGALISGSATEPYYEPIALTRDGVIVVTVDYRLGKLGFLRRRNWPRKPGKMASRSAITERWTRSRR